MAVPILPKTLQNQTTANANDVMANLNAIVAQLTANLDATNLKDGAATTPKIADAAVTGPKLDPALAVLLGISTGAVISRGQKTVATEEARTNVAYGELATPDRVDDVAMPANGLMVVSYQALWKESNSGAANAALFIGADQVKAYDAPSADPVVQQAISGGIADRYRTLTTFPLGLVSDGGVGVAKNAPPATGVALGQNVAGSHQLGGTLYGTATEPLGGLLVIDNLAAATYDVSVQFKASAGSVSAKQRRLKVWTIGF